MNQLKRRAPRQEQGELTDAGHWKVTGNWRDMPDWQIRDTNDFRDFYDAEEAKIQRGEAH